MSTPMSTWVNQVALLLAALQLAAALPRSPRYVHIACAGDKEVRGGRGVRSTHKTTRAHRHRQCRPRVWGRDGWDEGVRCSALCALSSTMARARPHSLISGAGPQVQLQAAAHPGLVPSEFVVCMTPLSARENH
jgi:hypothetical protein